MSKIFGIGLAKTGTTSFCHAMEILGYSACHFPFVDADIIESDVSADIPVADRFEELDKRFPGSKFVLTTRPMDDWLRSSEMHWHDKVENGKQKRIATLNIIKRLYGGRVPFEQHRFEAAYENHMMRVFNYFKDREDDLLVFSVFESEDPWADLCGFLGKDVPKEPFPHKNIAGEAVTHKVKSFRAKIKLTIRSVVFFLVKYKYQ